MSDQSSEPVDEQSARDPILERALEWLRADAERVERPLSNEEVERVAYALKLNPEQTAALFDSLECESLVDIAIEDLAQEQAQDPAIAEAVGAVLERGTMRAAMRLPLLNADEEKALARKIALAGGVNDSRSDATRLVREAMRARHRLALSNVRLVLSIARQYVGFSGEPLEDLFQEGIFGLMRACDKFDPDLGTRFSTYATWWIRQAITRALADKGKTIRVPVHMHEDVVRYQRAVRLLSAAKNGALPSLNRIAEELTWDPAKASFVAQVAQMQPLSIDYVDPDGFMIADTLQAPDSPETDTYRAQRKALTERIVAELTHRQEYVIRRRFGLNQNQEELTLERIGQELGVTRERIRQIEAKGLQRLRGKVGKVRLTEEDLDA